MRFLLDEMFDERVSASLIALSDEDEYLHIATEGYAGAKDPDIPEICKGLRVTALITANVRDFGARKVLYQALIQSGVAVVVVRPGKGRFDANQQVSVLTRHLRRLRTELENMSSPALIAVTQQGLRVRSLEELIDELSTDTRRLP